MEVKKSVTKINISTSTLLKIVAVGLGIYFLYLIKEILIILFVSLVFASAVDPWVDALYKRKIPRFCSIALFYLIFFGVAGTIIYFSVPIFSQQFNELSTNFPSYVGQFNDWFLKLKNLTTEYHLFNSLQQAISSFTTNFQSTFGGVFSTIFGIFGGIVSFVLVLVITFYMVVEENAMKKLVWALTPHSHQIYAMDLISRIQKKLGLWFRGQLILCFVIFALSYIGLSLLGVKYAFLLAIIAGIAEAIPYLGPIIGSIPAILVAFTIHPMLGLMVAVLYFAIQQVENYLLVPKVMEKAVGMHPLISMSVLMIGWQVAGVVGALLSIPAATALSVIVEDLMNRKDRK